MLKEVTDEQLIETGVQTLDLEGFNQDEIRLLYSSKALRECGLSGDKYYVWLLCAKYNEIEDLLDIISENKK